MIDNCNNIFIIPNNRTVCLFIIANFPGFKAQFLSQVIICIFSAAPSVSTVPFLNIILDSLIELICEIYIIIENQVCKLISSVLTLLYSRERTPKFPPEARIFPVSLSSITKNPAFGLASPYIMAVSPAPPRC